ncbi:MAG TPA: sigma-70 family RNA polymerase sigma factor [Solirubrobacteraceae bacterium]
MHKDPQSDRSVVEGRFARVFAHLDFIVQYARRRGARDPDGIAAEAMAIAWRRLADVPTDDPRPWLIVTARNLLLAEHRREPPAATQPLGDIELEAPADLLPSDWDLDPELAGGPRALSDTDREALLLIAWDDLTPALAAKSLGISPSAFRVRLHRARRRLSDRLSKRAPVSRASTHQPNVSLSHTGGTQDES